MNMIVFSDCVICGAEPEIELKVLRNQGYALLSAQCPTCKFGTKMWTDINVDPDTGEPLPGEFSSGLKYISEEWQRYNQITDKSPSE